jgi:tetratricopeptide (TPR) repeat protein
MGEKLLYVFYQDPMDAVTIHEYIESVDRLNELVEIQQTDVVKPGISNALYVNENRIHIRPDWLDKRPALVFPSEIPFNKNYFLGIVFGLLGNEEKYPQYLYAFPALLFLFDLIQAIIKGEEADSALENILKRTKFAHPFENYAFNHNVAVALNYGHYSNEINAEAIEAHYSDAIELAFEPSYKAFTLKYYAAFLIDNGACEAAVRILDQQNFKKLEDYPKYSLERVWCQAVMKQLTFPYNGQLIAELKDRLWETLQFFDKNGHKTIAAFLWMDAATIANFSNSYAESLGYISKAVSYFKDEGQHEMVAQAQLVRGRLFYDWAQSGNPQFYRSALEAYQEALKIFKRDDAPDVFADIHHQLGVIYAELPDENKKRSIWAALSATSFNEALNYYNKVDHPYEYGMISNNFANAYTKFPKGGRSDNFEKALWFYNEALSVRPALEYPTERAVTLLNYLESSWKTGNPDGGFNTERYVDMLAKAHEIKTLTDDEQLITETDKHLQMLEELEKELHAGG